MNDEKVEDLIVRGIQAGEQEYWREGREPTTGPHQLAHMQARVIEHIFSEAGLEIVQKGSVNAAQNMADKNYVMLQDALATRRALMREKESLQATNKMLVEALEEAKATIKMWHKKGIARDAEEFVWDRYQSSPEMVKINKAIAAAEGA